MSNNPITSALTALNTLPQTQANVTGAVSELKTAIKTQLTLQAISTAGLLVLVYLALTDRRSRSGD
jgi:hypothetical protein